METSDPETDVPEPYSCAIRKATLACISDLERCLTLEPLLERNWAESRLADTKLWASDVGALDKSNASLDNRLQFQPDIHFILKNRLSLLQQLVQSCRNHALEHLRGASEHDTDSNSAFVTAQLPNTANQKGSGSSSPSMVRMRNEKSDHMLPEIRMKKAMRDVEDILDDISRLGLTICKSGTPAILKEADYCFDPDDSTLRQLQTHLESILESLVNKNIARTDEDRRSWRRGITPEQQRLIQANLRRRHRFNYARRYYEELQRTATSTVEEEVISASMHTSLETYRVSLPASIQQYPLPPHMNEQGKGFRCPCCFQPLPVMFQEPDRWGEHIAGDLTPYTCPFPDCGQRDFLYISKNAWRDHISRKHGVGWVCRACTGTGRSTLVSTSEAFESHLHEHHEEMIGEGGLLDPASMHFQVVLPNIPSCPLCPWLQSQKTFDADANLEHISNCIHGFSLHALPWSNVRHEKVAPDGTPLELRAFGPLGELTPPYPDLAGGPSQLALKGKERDTMINIDDSLDDHEDTQSDAAASSKPTQTSATSPSPSHRPRGSRAKSMDVCTGTCSQSCQRHRPKSSTTEQNFLSRARLELLKDPNSSSAATERLWNTTQYTAGYHESRVKSVLDGFDQTFPSQKS